MLKSYWCWCLEWALIRWCPSDDNPDVRGRCREQRRRWQCVQWRCWLKGGWSGAERPSMNKQNGYLSPLNLHSWSWQQRSSVVFVWRNGSIEAEEDSSEVGFWLFVGVWLELGLDVSGKSGADGGKQTSQRTSSKYYWVINGTPHCASACGRSCIHRTHHWGSTLNSFIFSLPLIAISSRSLMAGKWLNRYNGGLLIDLNYTWMHRRCCNFQTPNNELG